MFWAAWAVDANRPVDGSIITPATRTEPTSATPAMEDKSDFAV
jgi:hypothetical protein